MYMDSSGANNITNAQIMDNAIIRSEWTNTPAQAGARLNLDGFPICIFHAKYVDNDGIPYNLDENGQRLEPEYLGIFNFNYDKKAKDLLGWNKYTDAAGVKHTYDFQGFEFRDNTSDICLQKGISGMLGFVNANTGYEWRWTTLSDLVDDFHDKHLGATIDGGYFDEDHNQYTEEQYIKNRVSKEAIALKPFNRFHITRDGKRYQVMLKQENGTYKPFNYLDFDRGTSVFNLEFGVKIAENAIYWQLPYGATFDTTSNKIIGGTRYPSGEGYYKYSRNPEHMAKFEYNDAEPYFTDLNNWEKLCDLDGVVYGMHESYTETADGDYILDPADDLYHPLSYYVMYNAAGEVDPAGTFIEVGEDEYEDISEAPRYTKTVEYIQVTNDDIIETEDLMREIYGHWYYCVDTLAHCTDKNYLPLIDSNRTYSDELGNNGNGLFIYDALLQYYCASVITALCDNFAKNMFIHSYDGGLTWSPAWYDMD